MRGVLAFLVLSTLPAAAQESRDETIELLGALSIAPQICGIPIDRAALGKLGETLLPDEPDRSASIFTVNNRIANEQDGWSDVQRRAWCEAVAGRGAVLGVMAK